MPVNSDIDFDDVDEYHMTSNTSMSGFAVLHACYTQGGKTPRQLAEEDRQLEVLSWVDSLSSERTLCGLIEE